MSKEIGLKLKQERINKKLTVDDVASKLKIRKLFIEAIEDGKFNELPGLTYIIGFVISYAKLLGIAYEPLVEALKSQQHTTNIKTNVGLASSKMESALPSFGIIALALVALVVVCIVWAFYGDDEAVKINKEIPVTIEKVNIKDVKKPEESNLEVVPVADVLKTELYKNQTSKPVVKKLEVENTIKIKPLLISEKPITQNVKAKYSSIPIENAKIVIMALEDSWVQIRKNEELLFSKILVAGDSYYISDYSDEIVMDIGNAGGIYITVEEKVLPALGAKGVIVRNFAFTKDSLDNFAKSKQVLAPTVMMKKNVVAPVSDNAENE